MTKLEILDILDKVFVGLSIQVEPMSKFSVIDITGTGLRFFTYSEDSSNSDCIWYCNVWIVNESKEIRIPNEMCREFIEEIYEHTKVLNKINVKVASIKKRFTEMNSQEAIRDMKLKTILDDKNS
jgi:hypothetical protein